ncbi:MAG: hypothetical protein OEL87_01585 [Nanoarchaeota archaeon]|nr:hypothetical protein [Nanoarchaeota archaeon]
MDIEFIGQLVDSMNDAVLKLEQTIQSKNTNETNKLRTFIFDLHNQISTTIGAQNA